MNLKHKIKTGILTSLVVCFASSIGLTKETTRGDLNGWGPFIFSMSLDEAKAVVGQQGTRTNAGTLLYDTRIENLDFRAFVVFFGQGDRIREINVELQGIGNLAESECRSRFQEISKLLLDRYGEPDVTMTEVRWPTPSHKKFQSEYKFLNGASIELINILRSLPDSLIPFDCAVGVRYLPGPVRATNRF
jgi:hypothetical protein